MTSELIKLAGTPIGARRLNLITAINDNVGRAGFEVSTKPFEQDHADYRQDWHVMQSDLRWMETRSWIKFEASPAGIDGVHIQSYGVEAALAFKTAREDVAARVKVARENYLRWLYNCYHNEVSRITYDDFRQDALGEYLGKEFADREILRAAQWLVDGGFITGQRMRTGSYANPQITNVGMEVIDRYESLANVPSSQQGSVTNNHVSIIGSPGSAVVQDSSNVNQSLNLTPVQEAKGRDFVDSAKAMILALGLTEPALEAAKTHVQDLEVHVNVGKDPGGAKALAQKLVEVISTGLVSAMVNPLVIMGTDFIASL